MNVNAKGARWTQLADSYGKWFGKELHPLNVSDYAMQVMSILSDAQEVGGLNQNSDANDYVNAAKVMLSRMIERARLIERKTGKGIDEVLNEAVKSQALADLVGPQ